MNARPNYEQRDNGRSNESWREHIHLGFPFSNKTLHLIDRKAFGLDLIEICVEDPEMIDVAAIGARARSVGIEVTVCGALKRLDVFFGNLKTAM